MATNDVLSTVSTRSVPQTEQAKPEQVLNAAGGYVFQADDEIRLHRFLTLGTDGSTYYTSAKDLTRDNAAAVFRAVDADPLKVVAKIVEISTGGRAPRQNPAIFALAIVAAHGNDAGRAAALAAVPQVCRTGSTLFTFVKYVEQFRGWGRGLRKAVGRWYDNRDADQLAYQLVKYRAREDWRHFDTLRLASDRGNRSGALPYDDTHAALYNWVCTQYAAANSKSPRHGRPASVDREGVAMTSPLPELIYMFEEIQATDNGARVAELVRASAGKVSWEMIPDRFINETRVWEALLDAGVPQTALMRQLPRLTRLGLGSGSTGARIANQLKDAALLKRGRVHPVNVLVAMKTYGSGHSTKGNTTWTPEAMISDALDAAFYNAFGAVESTGKATMLALDLSDSMTWQNCSGLDINPREACAALSMVTAAVEPNHLIAGFTSGGWSPGVINTRWGVTSGLSKLDISPRRRLDDIVKYISQQPAGGTDCSLPMVWAAANKEEVDTFVIYTDNETHSGTMHVDQALDQYRQRMSRPARLVVSSMTATGTSLCDPKDPLSMDISGFDSTCPQLITDFSAGRL